MIRVSTRDLLWLALVLGLSLGWWRDRADEWALRGRFESACTSAREAWHRTEFLSRVLTNNGCSNNGMENYRVFESYGNPVPLFENDHVARLQ